ncbi:uncharacterized protein LOC133186915 [Saccostrea echinata]|uniref:uncharacterized protein LOC133186915 n=1 Tax=Saccostrea echinata TaxID=191078 RepID=UPI002A803F36|nr:uncharacterized protein LOC133186915 [Saccostrea echinata]
MCHYGDCVRPDTCSCDPGWTGNACNQAMCDMPCTRHGMCTAPNTCTCENGWQGMTCEMPFAPGFNPTKIYIYNISISSTMEWDIMMNTNSFRSNDDTRQFLSNVNLTFSISTVKTQTNYSIGMLTILNAICHSDFGNQTKDFQNATCDQHSAKNLLQTKVMFSQDLTTGKIMHVYYNSSTEDQAIFIARLLRFIDCKTAPSNVESMEEKSASDGKQIILLRNGLKSEIGLQCFNFTRLVKNKENMITDREEKKVCLGETGAPQRIIMSEFYIIGKNRSEDDRDSLSEDEMNLSPLPSFKGHVFAVGHLVSMKTMANDALEDELESAHLDLASDNIKSSSIDELAFRKISTEKEYKHDIVYQDIKNVLRHPSKNLRLSLGLALVRKSESAISIIRKMIFSQNLLEKESRSLLIAILGSSQTFSGQKILMQMLDAEEKVKGDHYLALGSVAQMLKPSEDIITILSKLMRDALDDEVKTRAVLVLGVLGSRGLDNKVIPILNKELFKNNVTHDDKCMLISALGNTHSEKALQPLSNFVKSKDTFYKILSIRALKNIPGYKSYELVLDALLKTRNKKVALRCLKTLTSKGKWISQNDSDAILQIAYGTKDLEILIAIQNTFLGLLEGYTEKQKQDFQFKLKVINEIIVQLQNLEVHAFEIKRETQNFGVYFDMSVDSEKRGYELDFNGNSNFDIKVFGKRVNVLRAGTDNSYVDSGVFMSSVYMILNLFGHDYVLYMKSWKFSLNLFTKEGNPCQPNSGNIMHTFPEYFHFGDLLFTYGIPYIASINLKVGIVGSVSFGFGFDVKGNDGNMLPQQVIVIGKPEAKLTATASAYTSAVLVSAGVKGVIDVLTGSIQTNVALNLQQRNFCHLVRAEVGMLQGALFIFAEVGFSIFKKTYEIEIYNWPGSKVSKTVSESFCCANAFQSPSKAAVQSYNLLYPALSNVTELSYQRKISEALSVLTSIKTCMNSVNKDDCPLGPVQGLLNRGVYIFDPLLSKQFKENYVLTTLHIIPLLLANSGDYYGLDRKGNMVQVHEYGKVRQVMLPLINLLASLIYSPEIKQVYGGIMKNQVLLQQHPKRSLVKSTSNVLDLRPYCSKMMAICANIKMGKMDHGDTMTFTENKEIQSFNDKEACSAFIKSNGIRYPYYCEAYPFSFTLQGGSGATVMSVNVMEREVKMEAFNTFIKSSGLKGGDSFVVLV